MVWLPVCETKTTQPLEVNNVTTEMVINKEDFMKLKEEDPTYLQKVVDIAYSETIS